MTRKEYLKQISSMESLSFISRENVLGGYPPMANTKIFTCTSNTNGENINMPQGIKVREIVGYFTTL